MLGVHTYMLEAQAFIKPLRTRVIGVNGQGNAGRFEGLGEGNGGIDKRGGNALARKAAFYRDGKFWDGRFQNP